MSKSTKRRRRAAGQWIQLVEAWEASGHTAKQFAQKHDLAVSSLYAWRRRLREEGLSVDTAAKGLSMSFVPMEVDSSDSTLETSWKLEIASGLSLSMAGPQALAGLEVALRVLGDEVV